jgi:hypothetical protein
MTSPHAVRGVDAVDLEPDSQGGAAELDVVCRKRQALDLGRASSALAR